MKLTEADRKLIIQGIKSVAGVCDGAYRQDGNGFNKADTDKGHRLASQEVYCENDLITCLQLVIKYKRQLPKDWVEEYYRMWNGLTGKQWEK